MATIRELIDGLTELARTLPEGMDTPVQIGICNAVDLQLVPHVDVDQWTRVPGDGTPQETFALLRGHLHPWESSDVLYGQATDEELRNLTDGG